MCGASATSSPIPSRRGQLSLQTLKLSLRTFKLAVASLQRIPARAQVASPLSCRAAFRHPAAAPRQITTMAKGRKRKDTEPEEASQSKKTKAQESQPETSSDEEAGPSSGPASTGVHVNPKRYRELKGGEIKKGPVIYWWAMLAIFFANCCCLTSSIRTVTISFGS